MFSKWLSDWFTTTTIKDKINIQTECCDDTVSKYKLLISEMKQQFSNGIKFKPLLIENKPRFHTYTTAHHYVDNNYDFDNRCTELENKYNIMINDIDKSFITIKLDEFINEWNQITNYADDDIIIFNKLIKLQSLINNYIPITNK